jgi:hypothetical protein
MKGVGIGEPKVSCYSGRSVKDGETHPRVNFAAKCLSTCEIASLGAKDVCEIWVPSFDCHRIVVRGENFVLLVSPFRITEDSVCKSNGPA